MKGVGSVWRGLTRKNNNKIMIQMMYHVWRQLVSWTKNDKVGLEGWGGLRVGFGDRLQFEIGWLVTCEETSRWEVATELSRGEASRESTLSSSEGQQGGQGVQNAMRWDQRGHGGGACGPLWALSDFYPGWDRSHCGVWGTEVMWSDLWLKRIMAGNCVEHRVQWGTRAGAGRPVKRDRSR